jgi:hypothetical protein
VTAPDLTTWGDEDGADCSICGGEGYEDCPDPIQCMQGHPIGGMHRCDACGGTGMAKDQVMW